MHGGGLLEDYTRAEIYQCIMFQLTNNYFFQRFAKSSRIVRVKQENGLAFTRKVEKMRQHLSGEQCKIVAQRNV